MNALAGTITILSPVAEAKARPDGDPRPKRTLGQKVRLGLLSNGKPNTDFLIQGLLEVLKADRRLVHTIDERKNTSSEPADEAILARLHSSADLVVGATAD